MWMETHYEPFFTWLGGHPEQIGRFSRAMANLTDACWHASSRRRPRERGSSRSS